MKKLISLALIVLFVISCQPKAENIDFESAEEEITQVLEGLMNAFTKFDIEIYLTYLAEEGLYCGIDPSEVMDKSDWAEYWGSLAQEIVGEINLVMPLDKRIIRINSDGNSAIVLEQYIETSMLGPNLPLRVDYHLIKEDKSWLVDYSSWSLIPQNEDIVTIEAALQKE